MSDTGGPGNGDAPAADTEEAPLFATDYRQKVLLNAKAGCAVRIMGKTLLRRGYTLLRVGPRKLRLRPEDPDAEERVPELTEAELASMEFGKGERGTGAFVIHAQFCPDQSLPRVYARCSATVQEVPAGTEVLVALCAHSKVNAELARQMVQEMQEGSTAEHIVLLSRLLPGKIAAGLFTETFTLAEMSVDRARHFLVPTYTPLAPWDPRVAAVLQRFSGNTELPRIPEDDIQMRLLGMKPGTFVLVYRKDCAQPVGNAMLKIVSPRDNNIQYNKKSKGKRKM